jgi:hypothetical protein
MACDTPQFVHRVPKLLPLFVSPSWINTSRLIFLNFRNRSSPASTMPAASSQFYCEESLRTQTN